MSFRAKLILTVYYFRNAYKMLYMNSVSMFLAIFLVLTVVNLSESLILQLNRNQVQEYVLSLGDVSQSGLTDQDLGQFNHFFDSRFALKRLDTKRHYQVESLFGSRFELSVMEDISIREHSALIVSRVFAEAHSISAGDRLILKGMVLTVIELREDFMEYDAFVSRKCFGMLATLEKERESGLLLRVLEGHDPFTALSYINRMLGRAHYHYQMDLLDFSEVLRSVIILIRNFLLVIAGLIFFVSMFMIRNVIYISAIDRKDELVVLRSFGLSKKECEQLLLIEIVLLSIITCTIAMILVFIFVFLLTYFLKLPFSLNFYSNLGLLVSVGFLSYLYTLIFSRGLNRFEINDLD